MLYHSEIACLASSSLVMVSWVQLAVQYVQEDPKSALHTTQFWSHRSHTSHCSCMVLPHSVSIATTVVHSLIVARLAVFCTERVIVYCCDVLYEVLTGNHGFSMIVPSHRSIRLAVVHHANSDPRSKVTCVPIVHIVGDTVMVHSGVSRCPVSLHPSSVHSAPRSHSSTPDTTKLSPNTT